MRALIDGAGASTGSGLVAKARGFALYLMFQFTVVMSFIHMANFLRWSPSRCSECRARRASVDLVDCVR